ncbi:MAG: hypothetical protein ACI89L_002160 [Phycisphaerales bacterium]|jgi:hypothetical protein
MLTRMNRGSMYGLCLVALAGLPASAYAQVGTPPPAQGETAETYVPPAPPASFTAQGRTDLEAQAEQTRQLEAQRANAQANQVPAADPEAPKFKGIPNVTIPSDLLKNPRNSLVRGDGQGQLYDWWGSLDLHALKISPLISELKGEEIRSVIFDRHNRVEQRMIENLDLFLEIEATKDELGTDGGIGKLSQITAIIKPIVEPGTLSIDLYHAKALSAMQAKFNEEMVRVYKREETKGLSSNKANPIAGFVKFMVEDAMREPRFAHDLMVSEILTNYDAVIEKAGLSGKAELAPLSELAGQVGDEAPKRALVRRATPYIMGLTLDEHTSLLMAVRELRENPDHQPMLAVELTRDGQTTQVIEGDELTMPAGVKVGYAAIDPGATGKSITALSADQIPYYIKYLHKAWRVKDPEATGDMMETISDDYKAEYQKYMDARRAEIAAGDTPTSDTPSDDNDSEAPDSDG